MTSSNNRQLTVNHGLRSFVAHPRAMVFRTSPTGEACDARWSGVRKGKGRSTLAGVMGDLVRYGMAGTNPGIVEGVVAKDDGTYVHVVHVHTDECGWEVVFNDGPTRYGQRA